MWNQQMFDIKLEKWQNVISDQTNDHSVYIYIFIIFLYHWKLQFCQNFIMKLFSITE